MTESSRHSLRATGIAVIVIGVALGLCACRSHNPTTITRETGARPRLEQLALSTAMHDAYGRIDFAFVEGRQVFTKTEALAKTDIEFINSYVQKVILGAGGRPVVDEKDAELTLTSTIEVSGTDEVEKGKGVLIGQFKGTLSVLDSTSGEIQEIYDLNSVVKTKRNKKGETRVLNN